LLEEPGGLRGSEVDKGWFRTISGMPRGGESLKHREKKKKLEKHRRVDE